MSIISEFTHFYYLKWRHLVNRFPLDNAALKLQHHAVGRRLAHRKDKCCVCRTRGQGQLSILVMRSFLAKGYCIRAKVRRAAITSGHFSKMARRLTPPEAINVKMSSIYPNMTL